MNRTGKDLVKKIKKSGVQVMVAKIGLPEPPKKAQQLDQIRTKYVPFGNRNLFPSDIAARARRSPTFRAILRKKVIFAQGNNFVTENTDLEKFIETPNNKNSLRDLTAKWWYDKFLIGNSYIQMVKPDRKSDQTFFFHTDATQPRISKDGKMFYLSAFWDRVTEINDERVIHIPKYPVFEKPLIGTGNGAAKIKDFKGVTSIFQVKEFEPEFKFYGLPQGLAAYNSGWLDIDYLIGRFNRARFDNKFTTSGILFLNSDLSPEEAQEIENQIVEKYQGEDNNSRILIVAKDADSEKSTFKPITDIDKGTFMDLHEVTVINIISSLQFPPSLSGLQLPGKLGQNQEKRTDYEEYINTDNHVFQEDLLTPLRKLITEETGIDASDLTINNKIPFSMLSQDTIGTIIKEDDELLEIVKDRLKKELE